MIKLIDGNLLDFPNGINQIAHSCNTLNVMGAGIAKQIKDRYPLAWNADCIANQRVENILGSWSFGWADNGECQKGIYNLYTQEKVGNGREVNYEAFYLSLLQVEKDLVFKKNSGDEIIFGLPYGISCGLAGGSIRIINTMIHDIFTKSPIDLLMVRYKNQV